tara:strand:+ start:553 stop:801 length:249 start_codon:yes stop_codon:yes gene_type:complete
MQSLSGSLSAATDMDLMSMLDLVSTQKDIIMMLQRYEAHQMTATEEVSFFQYLVDAGIVWAMPSSYISRAEEMLEKRFIWLN